MISAATAPHSSLPDSRFRLASPYFLPMEHDPPESSSEAPGPEMSPGTSLVFRLSIWMAVAAGILLVFDLIFGLRLPQPVRPAMPVVLAVGLCVALVLGVATFGAPSRPGQRRNEEPGP